MPQKSSNILVNSRIIVGMMAAVLLVLGLVLVGQGMVDTRGFRDRVIQAVKDQAGVTMTVKGEVSVSLVPMPTFYFPKVELRGGDSEPSVTVEMLIARVSLFSLFSGHPQITGLALDHPLVEVERTQDNVIHWGWLSPALLKPMQNSSPMGTVSLATDEGRILYHDNHADHDLTFDHISLSGAVGHRTDLSGTMDVGGHPLRLKLEVDEAASGPQPLSVAVSAGDDNKLGLKGSIDLSGATPKINGTLTLALADAGEWFQEKIEEKHALLDKVMLNSSQVAKENTALPVSFSAELAQEGSALHLTNAKWDGFNSAGEGSLALTWDDLPSATADMAFSTLDATLWTQMTGKVFQATAPQVQAAAYGVSDQPQANPLPQELRMSLNVTAQKLLLGGQAWQNAKIQAQLDSGAITVNQFTLTMPGETTLALFGVISHDVAKGLRFEGSMETSGKSLRQFLTVFDESAADLPETGLGAFYAHANIFVSPEQLRLSEADVKINDLELNGGLVAYYDANTRLEADVRLKDINFDYFRDVWRAAGPSKNHNAFFLTFSKNGNFNWLRRLQTTVDFKVNVEGFTFLERKGNSASFRLFARDGQFGIYDIRFYYPNETMDANFTLDVTGAQPAVKLLLNANALDLDYFRAAPPADAPAAKPDAPAAVGAPKTWSEDLIDMNWMSGLGGIFDISIGALTSGGTTVNNLKLKATLDNNLLTFQSLSFLYWQGKWDVRGSVFGGEVPGVSLSFTLFDAELHDILKALAGRDNITGRVSVSGTVATSGVNPLSWVSQLESKLVLTGRGVNVQGFNMQGVVDTVNASRTAADVFANVNRAVRDGATQMSVDGNLNIRNGIARTPGITLKAGAITGNLTGDIKLVPWTMELSTLFQFPSMPSETIPTMTMRLEGPIDKPELQVDTASLEAYVAKRIVGK